MKSSKTTSSLEKKSALYELQFPLCFVFRFLYVFSFQTKTNIFIFSMFCFSSLFLSPLPHLHLLAVAELYIDLGIFCKCLTFRMES